MKNAEKQRMRGRLSGIDLIKTIAIICIIITHYPFTNLERKWVLFPYIIEMAMPCLMIVTGYNAGNRRNRFTYTDCLRYFQRLFPPWIIFMIVEISLFRYYGMTWKDIFQMMVVYQNYGQGSYFPWVYLKIVLMLPLIDYMIRNFKGFGLAMLIMLHLLFEIAVSYFDMSTISYRLTSMRYLGFVAVGFYYTQCNYCIEKIDLAVLGGLGGVMIYFLNYHKPLFLFKQWRVTSLPVIVYAFVLVVIALKYYKYQSSIIELIAKSTFHIFLVQMVYYRFYYDNIAYVIKPMIICIMINILICVFTGIVFRAVSKWISEAIEKRLQHKIS